MSKFTSSVLGAAVLAAGLSFGPVKSEAATIDAPVPVSFIETVGSQEWVWASFCSPTGCNTGAGVVDLSFQGTLGWRLPTVSEVSALVTSLGGFADTASTFGALGCALEYFTNETGTSCSTVDLSIGAIYNFQGDYVGNPNVDTLVVRDFAPVPVPGSLPLLAGGLIAGAALLRRRSSKN